MAGIVEEDSTGSIKRIVINNYREKTRLSEIFNTSTWVFARMVEKDGTRISFSSDFKKMVQLFLEKKPEITAEQIRELIDEKKRNVGAGYLTDQGALFLVAADLGISFII